MNKRIIGRALLPGILALGLLPGLWGCGHKNADNPVLARVGDQSVTRSQLQAAYSLPVQTDSLTIPAYEEAARDWAVKQILLQEAEKRHLDQDSLFLARMENLRRELLMGVLYDRSAGALEVDSAEVSQEYNKHRDEYEVPADQVDLVYIIASSRESAAQARESLQNGMSLAGMLAADTALTGQVVGWVSQSDLDPAVARAAFTLVPGGVSYPQKRDDGRYIVVQARQRRLQGTVKSFEEVFEEVRSRLLLNKQAEAEKALRDSLWSSYKPEILVGTGTSNKGQE